MSEKSFDIVMTVACIAIVAYLAAAWYSTRELYRRFWAAGVNGTMETMESLELRVRHGIDATQNYSDAQMMAMGFPLIIAFLFWPISVPLLWRVELRDERKDLKQRERYKLQHPEVFGITETSSSH